MALILFGGAILQGTVGFGMGMFSIPLLVWSGLSLPQAIAATLPAVLVQSSFNCWQHREHLPWKPAITLFVLRASTVPLGIWLLSMMVEWDPSRIKQMIGAFLLTALATIWAVKPTPVPKVRAGWTIFAGTLSGTLVGLVGMGGPPVSLWVLAHDWPPITKRCCLWLSFLMLLPFHAAMLVWQFGSPLFQSLVTATVVAPATILGAIVGAKLGSQLNAKGLRIAMLSLLLFIAVRALVAPWFG